MGSLETSVDNDLGKNGEESVVLEKTEYPIKTEKRLVKQSIYDVLGANDQELARRQYHDEDGDDFENDTLIVKRSGLGVDSVVSTGVDDDEEVGEDDRDIDDDEDEDNIKNSSTGSSPADRRSVDDSTPFHSISRDRQSQIESVASNDILNEGSLSIDSSSMLSQQRSDLSQFHTQGDKLDSRFESSPPEEPEQLRKLFIGGLDYKTSESTLRNHFGHFGEVIDCVVMREPQTKRSRGFGFVIYANSSMVDRAQEARPHEVDGRSVQSKRAISREDSGKPEAQATVKKVYLGGLSDDVAESELRDYFQAFGNIVNINIVAHKDTGKRRGFAFVEYDDYDPVDKIVLRKFHTIKDKRVEAKKAIPKVEMDARKRGDPRAVMTNAMMSLPGSIDGSGSIRSRSGWDISSGSLWDNGPYNSGFHAAYQSQTELSGFPHHYGYPNSSHHGVGGWMVHGGGANQLASSYGNFRHGSSGPYASRNNYSGQPGRWPEYGSFSGPEIGSIGPMRGHGLGGGNGASVYQHRRFDPYSNYGGPHRGRGYNL